MGRRSGLGRGLDALIPSTAPADHAEPSGPADPSRAGDSDRPGAPVDGADLRELPLDVIVPNRYQPRAGFEEGALQELATSIEALGVLQPILVQEHAGATGVAGSNSSGPRFEIIAGERRWRAAQLAGLTAIPAIVRSVAAQQSLEQALVENLQREDLNPVEEAVAYRQLADEFGLSHDEIAARVGRSRSAVTNTLRLLNLAPPVLELVSGGQLGAGHGRALLGIEDPDQQAALAKRAATEGWSVRRVEDEVKLRVDTPLARTAPAPAPDAAADRGAALLELEGLLSDHLDTRVTVQLGGSRGKVLIEFAGIEDLERIYRAIVHGPEGGG
jgi:ParB family chromosome partitioning protein